MTQKEFATYFKRATLILIGCLLLFVIARISFACTLMNDKGNEIETPVESNTQQELASEIDSNNESSVTTEKSTEAETDNSETNISIVLAPTTDAGQEYINDIVFLGDSTTYALSHYGLINKNQIWTGAGENGGTIGTLSLYSNINKTKIYYPDNDSSLTIEEAATLVGMVNKPTRYNPALNPDKSLVRRNFVISQMEKAGFITRHEEDSLQAIPITLSYSVQDHNAGYGPYFRDMLRRTMNAKEPKRSSYAQYEDYVVDSLQWADNAFYGWLNKNKKADGSRYNLDKDGLRIYTTINYNMQKYAEEAVKEHLGKDLQKSFWRDIRWKKNKPFSDEIEPEIIDRLMKQARRWSDRYRIMKANGSSEAQIWKSFSEPVKMRVFSWNKNGYIDTTMTPDDSIKYYKSHLRAAFMAIEPHTGHIKAYVGGPDYRYFKYDNVRQGKRQVGSTIKPFLYTLAMQEGMTPCDRVVNVPQTFVVGDTTWTPKSTDRDDWIGQTVTLKWGLTKSSNNISAYLMKQYGPHAMTDMMRKMGVGSYIDETYSLCVGSADISVYEMVAAYNTFPSKGVFVSPIFVTRIEDNLGNVLGEFNNVKREAISEYTAYLMANLMQGVVNSGTGVRLRAKYGLKGEIAGKTGTTNDQSDGWFIGYTPTLTAGVWVGAEDRQVHFESLALGGGSNMALPIWGLFMQKVHADPTLGVSEADRFVSPGVKLNLDCDGSDADASATVHDDESYFFD